MTREEAEKYAENMTYREAIYNLKQAKSVPYRKATFIKVNELLKALEQEPRKGEWLRMSDLSEQEDDRYKCSRCGNVIHHKNEMNLYTFNSWCGRCGSDNGRHIKYEVEE
jgi:adenine-specific DNA methylase